MVLEKKFEILLYNKSNYDKSVLMYMYCIQV